MKPSWVLWACLAAATPLASRLAFAQDPSRDKPVAGEKHEGGDASKRKLDDDAAMALAGRIANSDDEPDAKKGLEELRRMGDQGIWDLLETAKGAADEDVDVLATAIALLGRDAVPELIHTLNDEDEDVVDCALAALEDIGRDAFPALVKAVKDLPKEGRSRAAALLAKLVPDCIVPLIAIVRDGPNEARAAAAAAVITLGEPAIKPLVGVLPTGRAGRQVAAAALLQLGVQTPKCRTAIFKATVDQLKSKNDDVRDSVVELVGKYGGTDAMPAILEGLASGDAGLRRSAGECSVFVGEAAVEDLAHCLMAEDDKVAETAALALADIGEPAVAKLRKYLKAPTAPARRHAVGALGTMKHKPSVPFVLPLLDDPEERVRAEARVTLLEITGEKLESKDAGDAWWLRHKDDEDSKDGFKKPVVKEAPTPPAAPAK